MNSKNVLDELPTDLHKEVFETLISADSIRIERITSLGHKTPDGEWYNQEENEWVMVLQGSGSLTFEDGTITHLSSGDYVNIPAHCKHRVTWTDPNVPTVWLAVFYT